MLELGGKFGHYRLESRLGAGGMGEVFAACDTTLGRRVAVKVIATELAGSEGAARRFERECRLAAAIDHPHVIPIHEAGECDGRLFLAMRLVDGVDLRTLAAGLCGLALERAVVIVAQVASALDAVHGQGLVHRDVKPRNVLIAEVDGADHAYLCDFGVAAALARPSTGLTRTGDLMGTLGYAAPEQLRGEWVDARADVYSLGCVLFESLAGRGPFSGLTEGGMVAAQLIGPPPSLRGLGVAVPEPVDRIIARALDCDRSRRFDSAGELAAAVNDVVPVAQSRPRRGREAQSREVTGADARDETKPATAAPPPDGGVQAMAWEPPAPAATGVAPIAPLDLRQPAEVVATLDLVRARFETGAAVPVGIDDLLRKLADALAESGPLELGVSSRSWLRARNAARALATLPPGARTAEHVEARLGALRRVFAAASRSSRWRSRGESSRASLGLATAALIVLVACATALSEALADGRFTIGDFRAATVTGPVVVLAWMHYLRRLQTGEFARAVLAELAPADRALFAVSRARSVVIATDRRVSVITRSWRLPPPLPRPDTAWEPVWDLDHAQISAVSFATRLSGEPNDTQILLHAGARHLSIEVSRSADAKALVAIVNHHTRQTDPSRSLPNRRADVADATARRWWTDLEARSPVPSGVPPVRFVLTIAAVAVSFALVVVAVLERGRRAPEPSAQVRSLLGGSRRGQSSCASGDLEGGTFSSLRAVNTTCSVARGTARDWHNSLACAGQTCTVNHYLCTVSFFLGSGGTHSGHITCTQGVRVVKYDFHP